MRQLHVAATRSWDGGQGAARAVRAGREVAETGKLPVPTSAAGGIATPADAALVMQLGAEAVFVGSGIFKSEDPATRARGDRPGHDALPRRRAAWPRACEGLGQAMASLETRKLDERQLLANRGW